MLKMSYIIIVAFTLFLSGLLIHESIILDTSFGLAYYVSDSLGFWRHGLTWVSENRPLAIFCFLIFPAMIAVLFSFVIVKAFFGLWKHAKSSGLLFLVIVLALLFGLQSSPKNRISHFMYSAVNY